MLYYKVDDRLNGRKWGKYTFVMNELITEKEAGGFGLIEQLSNKVNISPRNTYFMFGCRFEKQIINK